MKPTSDTKKKAAAFDAAMAVMAIPGLEPTVCILLGVLMENQLLGELGPGGVREWTDLAMRVSGAMCRNDEPRFSLYDYLDAVVNMPPGMEAAYAAAKDGTDDELFRCLVDMAEAKRDTYAS